MKTLLRAIEAADVPQTTRKWARVIRDKETGILCIIGGYDTEGAALFPSCRADVEVLPAYSYEEEV